MEGILCKEWVDCLGLSVFYENDGKKEWWEVSWINGDLVWKFAQEEAAMQFAEALSEGFEECEDFIQY